MVFCYSAFVGIGFYGNEEVRKATNQFKSIVEDSEETVLKAHNEVSISIIYLNCYGHWRDVEVRIVGSCLQNWCSATLDAVRKMQSVN